MKATLRRLWCKFWHKGDWRLDYIEVEWWVRLDGRAWFWYCPTCLEVYQPSEKERRIA